jgi:MoaA/NifB/PqqE/SkfB family radical SAM enzyme
MEGGMAIMTSNYYDYKAPAVLRHLDSMRHGWRQFWPSLQIGLTDKCFNKCPMCGHWKRKEMHTLDLDQLIYFLSIGSAHGLETVGYSGGDPMAEPELLNMVMVWHRASEVAFGIVTSGFVPEKVDLKLLAEASWVRVSLDTVDMGRYNQIRGGDIHCLDVLGGIKKMVKAGVKVGVGTVLHKLNYNKIHELGQAVVGLGVKEFRVWPVRSHPTSQGMALGTKELFEAKQQLISLRGLLEANHVDNNIENAIGELFNPLEFAEFRRCYVSLYQAFVDASGYVYTCCTTAGDTEAQANQEPLGSLQDCHRGLYTPCQVYEKAVEFSKIEAATLPGICRSHCITRHIIANRIAEQHWGDICFQ